MPFQLGDLRLLALVNDVGCGLTYEADGAMGRCCVKVYAPWKFGGAGLAGQQYVTSSYQGISVDCGSPSPTGAISDAAVADASVANSIAGMAPVIATGVMDVQVEVCLRPFGPIPGGAAAQEWVSEPSRGTPAVAQCPWLASPWIDGAPLDVMLRSRKLSAEEAVPALRALSRSVALLHERKIAHGDIVPSKVIVDFAASRVTLLDTGAWSIRSKSEEQLRRWRRSKTIGMRITTTEVLADFPLRLHGVMDRRPGRSARSERYSALMGDLKDLGELASRMFAGPEFPEGCGTTACREAIGRGVMDGHPSLRDWVRACLPEDAASVRFQSVQQASKALDALQL